MKTDPNASAAGLTKREHFALLLPAWDLDENPDEVKVSGWTRQQGFMFWIKAEAAMKRMRADALIEELNK